MGGLYNIRAWADIVTSHSISGPDVVDGIAAAWEAEERVGGVLLLAQMSSRENLLKDGYTKETLAIGRGSPRTAPQNFPVIPGCGELGTGYGLAQGTPKTLPPPCWGRSKSSHEQSSGRSCTWRRR